MRTSSSGALQRSMSKRPRLWVPGVAWVRSDGELQAGEDVGYAARGAGWRALPCGHEVRVVDWRHCAWFVARARLTTELIREHALIEPHTLLDPEAQPHARRWLEEQPLLAVSGAKAQRLMKAGLRVTRVEHGVETDDHFVVEAAGGDRPPWKIEGRIGDLMPDEVKAVHALGDAEPPERVRFVDRLLQRLTRGALREASVVNALAARRVVEPGYGYRGATDGLAASIEQVQRDFAPLEALFAQIYPRAEPHRADARRIEIELRRAPASSEELEVPVYDRCHRRALAEMRLTFDPSAPASSPRYLIDGAAQRELLVEAFPRWFVDRVRPWEPEAPRVEVRPSRQGAIAARPWMVLLLVGLLLAVLAAGWLSQAAP